MYEVLTFATDILEQFGSGVQDGYEYLSSVVTVDMALKEEADVDAAIKFMYDELGVPGDTVSNKWDREWDEKEIVRVFDAIDKDGLKMIAAIDKFQVELGQWQPPAGATLQERGDFYNMKIRVQDDLAKTEAKLRNVHAELQALMNGPTEQRNFEAFKSLWTKEYDYQWQAYNDVQRARDFVPGWSGRGST